MFWTVKIKISKSDYLSTQMYPVLTKKTTDENCLTQHFVFILVDIQYKLIS